MKIQSLHNKIANKLLEYTNFELNALIYSKNSENGDFSIHTSRLENKHAIESIISNFDLPHIQAVIQLRGSICFFVDKKSISRDILNTIFKENETYGMKEKNGKLVVVEYSSPNIAKKFHPGHFRNTVLGNFIDNLLKANGYQTYTINYLGDWGKQFGLIGVGFNKYGNEDEMERDPIKHLYDVYVSINKDAENDKKIDENAKAWFADLEKGKEKNVRMWKRFRDMSIEKYKKLYQLMNCSFDEYSGESYYALKSKEIIATIENKQKEVKQNIKESLDVNFKINDNSKYKKTEVKQNNKESLDVDFLKNDDNDNSKYIQTSFGKLCVIKNDGSTLYSTRDIAAAVDRLDRLNPDEILYVVASQQDLYFKQLFNIFQILGYGYKNNEFIFKHINYGMVNGMSTRKGTVVFLEDILNEAKEVMLSKMKKNEEKFKQINDVNKTCEILALSALVIQDFSAKRIKNYDFNMERNTETNGFTGPYLQYMHCRLMSLEDKNKELINKYLQKGELENQILNDEYNPIFLNDKTIEIIYFLFKYPFIIERCKENYEPSTLVTYLMDLCKSVNSIISDLRVMGEENKIAITRLYFYKCVRIVVGNGIRILGLTPLERM
ncbi:arginyl-tRNA synthetase [Conglomerata obtusa]